MGQKVLLDWTVGESPKLREAFAILRHEVDDIVAELLLDGVPYMEAYDRATKRVQEQRQKVAAERATASETA